MFRHRGHVIQPLAVVLLLASSLPAGATPPEQSLGSQTTELPVEWDAALGAYVVRQLLRSDTAATSKGGIDHSARCGGFSQPLAGEKSFGFGLPVVGSPSVPSIGPGTTQCGGALTLHGGGIEAYIKPALGYTGYIQNSGRSCWTTPWYDCTGSFTVYCFHAGGVFLDQDVTVPYVVGFKCHASFSGVFFVGQQLSFRGDSITWGPGGGLLRGLPAIAGLGEWEVGVVQDS